MVAAEAERGTKRTKLCHAKRFAQMKNENLFVKRCFSLASGLTNATGIYVGGIVWYIYKLLSR